MKKHKKIEPILVTIDSLGNQNKTLLLPNDSSKTKWRLYLSFKVNGNQILMAGKEKGKYRFAKAGSLSPQNNVQINPGR